MIDFAVIPSGNYSARVGPAGAEHVREALLFRWGSWEAVERSPDGRRCIAYYLADRRPPEFEERRAF
jgi:hypothetical protein